MGFREENFPIYVSDRSGVQDSGILTFPGRSHDGENIKYMENRSQNLKLQPTLGVGAFFIGVAADKVPMSLEVTFTPVPVSNLSKRPWVGPSRKEGADGLVGRESGRGALEGHEKVAEGNVGKRH